MTRLYSTGYESWPDAAPRRSDEAARGGRLGREEMAIGKSRNVIMSVRRGAVSAGQPALTSRALQRRSACAMRRAGTGGKLRAAAAQQSRAVVAACTSTSGDGMPTATGEPALLNAYERFGEPGEAAGSEADTVDADENAIGSDADFLVGYEVVRRKLAVGGNGDEALEVIGVVCEIIDLPHGHFLVRVSPSMALVPFEEGIVLRCDEDARQLLIDPPYGLLEVGEELAEMKEGIRAMMADRELRSFPSYAELAEDADLYETVMRLGGRYFCARSMGVLFEARREQKGNWDLSGIRAMLVLHLGLDGDADIADQNIEMPRSTALMRARRWEIHHAILHAGGYARVARQLGFRYTRKPYSPSPKVIVEYPTGDELHAQLLEFMEEKASGDERTLPRMSLLKKEKPELYRVRRTQLDDSAARCATLANSTSHFTHVHRVRTCPRVQGLAI